MRSWIQSLSRHKLVRNSLWMFAGRGVRLVIQAVYFILIARTLKPAHYGAFVGALSLVGIVAPFATLGSGNLLVKHVARDASTFRERWGNALFLSITSGLLLIFFVSLLSRVALPASLPLLVVVLIGFADILFFRLIEVCGQAFQAMERLDGTALVYIAVSGARLGGVVILASLVHSPTVQQWALLYAGTTAIATLGCVLAVVWSLGTPLFRMSLTWPELREGAYFSVSLSAQGIYNDLDKTMLARMSTLDATGIYGVAYRIIDVSFSPVSAVLAATYASFFRHGASGICATRKFAQRILPRSGAYGILVGVTLYLLAPKVPLILGKEYAASVEAIRWLAPIPFLRSLHYFLSDALTGAGYQGFRSAAQVGVAILNFGLNLWLLPAYGWRGAAWASIASDGMLLIAIATVLWLVGRRGARELQPVVAS